MKEIESGKPGGTYKRAKQIDFKDLVYPLITTYSAKKPANPSP